MQDAKDVPLIKLQKEQQNWLWLELFITNCQVVSSAFKLLILNILP